MNTNNQHIGDDSQNNIKNNMIFLENNDKKDYFEIILKFKDEVLKTLDSETLDGHTLYIILKNITKYKESLLSSLGNRLPRKQEFKKLKIIEETISELYALKLENIDKSTLQ